MKLYTEEQVIQMITSSYLHGFERAHDYKDVKEHILKSVNPIKLQSVTTIKLPSDEELKKQFDVDEFDPYDLAYLGGAIRMRNLIQGGNK